LAFPSQPTIKKTMKLKATMIQDWSVFLVISFVGMLEILSLKSTKTMVKQPKLLRGSLKAEI
jgi:hypothetical protein